MGAAELFTLGRVVSARGPIAHGGDLRHGEQLKLALPHGPIIPGGGDRFRPRQVVDHANFKGGPLMHSGSYSITY
jgi:hypothetical protein